MKHRSVCVLALVLLLVGSLAVSQDKRRTERFAIPWTVTGASVGQCENFEVLNDWTALYRGTIVYDKSGSVMQTIQHIHVIGESIYYNSADPSKSVLGGPGELENDRIVTGTGVIEASGPLFRIRIPGYGVIFAETGHAVLDLTTGQIIFNSGHNQFFDQDLAALCNYLK